MDTSHPILQEITEQSGGNLDAILLAQASSTNDSLKEMALDGKLSKPTVLITDHQTAGRGTRGREWFQAPQKDIAFSLALPFLGDDLHDPRISLAAGAMVARELESAVWPHHPGMNVALKWPNDILLGEPPRKCGGILIETSSGWMLFGIGVNLNSVVADFPLDLAPRITTVREQLGHKVDREQVITTLVVGIASALGITGGEIRDSINVAAWVKEWCARDVTGNKHYLLNRSGQSIHVVAQGVDFETGGLLCKAENGQAYTVTSYTDLTEMV